MEILIVTVFFILILSWNHETDYYGPKWSLLAGLALAGLAYNIYLQSFWFFAFPFVVLTPQVLATGTSRFFKHYATKYLNKEQQMKLVIESCRTLISFFAVAIIFISVNGKMLYWVNYIIPFLIAGNMIWKFLPKKYKNFPLPHIQQAKIENIIHGLGANSSVDATLTSILAMFYICSDAPNTIKYAVALMAFVSIIKTKASSGLGAFVISFIFYLVFVDHFYYAFAITPIALGIGYKVYGKGLWSLSGREYIWEIAMKELYPICGKITGLMGGAYRVMMPFMENKLAGKVKPTSFLWAHSDLLQIAVEYGFLGILSAGLFLGGYINYGNAMDYAFMICVLLNCVANFPLHMAPDVLIITLYLKRFAYNHGG